MITGGGTGCRRRRIEEKRIGDARDVVEERERVWDSGCKGKGSGGREGIEWAGWQQMRSRLSPFDLVEGTNEGSFMR